MKEKIIWSLIKSGKTHKKAYGGVKKESKKNGC